MVAIFAAPSILPRGKEGLKMTTPVRTQRDRQDLFKISPETGGGGRQRSHVLGTSAKVSTFLVVRGQAHFRRDCPSCHA